MVRAPCCEKMGLKRGPWSPEEDQLLISYIHQHGHQNWRALPKQAGLLRCGKSCRLRWINYLKPDIKRGNLSQEEEETIIKLQEMLGNRWSTIAARLPGRTDNEIKNIWNTHLKKKLKDNQSSCDTKRFVRISNPEAEAETLENSDLGNLRQVVTSPRFSEVSSVTNLSMGRAIVKKEEMDYSSEYSPQIDESFWTEELSTVVPIKAKVEVNATETQGLDLKNDESMDYWYDIFIGAGNMPDLPEF